MCLLIIFNVFFFTYSVSFMSLILFQVDLEFRHHVAAVSVVAGSRLPYHACTVPLFSTVLQEHASGTDSYTYNW